MKLKNSDVNVNGIRPELVLALVIANDIYANHGENLVITSLNDGKHSQTSLHYSGCAADLRTRYFLKSEQSKVVNDLKEALTIDFDVVLEKDHIHLEYQPKRRN